MEATDVSNWISEPLDELQEPKKENVQTLGSHAGRCGCAEQQLCLFPFVKSGDCKWESWQIFNLIDIWVRSQHSCWQPPKLTNLKRLINFSQNYDALWTRRLTRLAVLLQFFFPLGVFCA